MTHYFNIYSRIAAGRGLTWTQMNDVITLPFFKSKTLVNRLVRYWRQRPYFWTSNYRSDVAACNDASLRRPFSPSFEGMAREEHHRSSIIWTCRACALLGERRRRKNKNLLKIVRTLHTRSPVEKMWKNEWQCPPQILCGLARFPLLDRSVSAKCTKQ